MLGLLAYLQVFHVILNSVALPVSLIEICLEAFELVEFLRKVTHVDAT